MSDAIQSESIIDWDDNQWSSFKQWLEDLLRDNTVELIFKKADGTIRTLQATKKYSVYNEYLKQQEKQKREKQVESGQAQSVPEKPKETKQKNLGDALLVWDVEINNWRIVKIRNLLNILTLIIKYDYCDPTTNLYEVVF